MRLICIAIFLSAVASVRAEQPAASEQLKQKFMTIFRQELSEMVAPAVAANPRISVEELSHYTDDLVARGSAAYASVFNLPDSEAKRLLTNGTDDQTNLTAMWRDIELWKKVEVPMPTLYKQMQDKVTSGRVTRGLELELTRRISEFHLRLLSKL